MTLIRDVLRVARLPLLRNLRCTLSLLVTNLIADWGQCNTNRRRTLLDVHLLYDAPHGHPGFRLHVGASQDLAVALYLHKQYTHIEIYRQMEIAHSIIFTNQILHKVFTLF
jgi:hypothetical protein